MGGGLPVKLQVSQVSLCQYKIERRESADVMFKHADGSYCGHFHPTQICE